MRNSVKKTLIALFTSVLAVMMLLVVATNMRVVKASAEVSKVEFDAPMVSGEYIDDFYMIDDLPYCETCINTSRKVAERDYDFI